jgi:hypothetical protein
LMFGFVVEETKLFLPKFPVEPGFGRSALLDCGGKRSATPLSQAHPTSEFPPRLVRSKAVSPLRSATALQNAARCIASRLERRRPRRLCATNHPPAFITGVRIAPVRTPQADEDGGAPLV